MFWVVRRLCLGLSLLSNMKAKSIQTIGAALVIVLTGCASAQHKPANASWGPPSPRAVQTAQAQKRPVIIAFDADWCRQTHNAKNFFDSPDGRQLLATSGARGFRVDCTTETPDCKNLMKRYGAKTIPSYVIFEPGTREPILLDGAELTPGSLRDSLEMSHKRE